MKKEELLKIANDGHLRVLRTLDCLSESDVTRVGFNAEWSVKDLLAHLTAWKKRSAAELVSLAGGTWTRQKLEMDAVHEFNRETVGRSRAQSLAEIRSDFERTHAELLRLISALPDEIDEDWAGFRIVNGSSVRHFAHHAAQLENWQAKLTAGD